MILRITSLAALVILPLVALASTEEEKAARATLDRAIAAMGGTKRLSSPHALAGTSKGTLHANGRRVAVRNEWTVQGLDRLRWSSELTVDERTTTFLIVLQGSKGWIAA